MKFAALISGGKDSIYSIMECVKNGHELVACIHLGAPLHNDEESYMYQTAASEVIPILVEECLGVPLILHRRVGTSVNTSLVYETISEADEVEDLYVALSTAQQQFPEIQAISSGAILSTYQRVRIEHVCSRLGLTSFSYLWRLAPQRELLERMLQDGITAVLVKTACPPGLVPQKHLHKTLNVLYQSGLLEKLHAKYQFQMCGEGGEYESLVIDCPLYHKRLVLDEVEIQETDDGVGVLVIKKCHAESKNEQEPTAKTLPIPIALSTTTPLTESRTLTRAPILSPLPQVRRATGGLFHVSEIMSPIVATVREGVSEAELAVEEALAVLKILKQTLTRNGATAQDVILVHLYLSEISHFANINAHYKEFFGTLLPPSRSCVAVGKYILPGGRRIMLDCIVQCESGQYMRKASSDDGPYTQAARLTTTSSLRQVLHVQSISHWAPVCVGPYSQVNTLRSGLHFLAGQIGLVPSTMQLRETWTSQLEQCWTNVARVLDALDGGSFQDILSCLVYVSDKVYLEGGGWDMVESISKQKLSNNGGVIPGDVESNAVLSGSLYGGYEDKETWKEMTMTINTSQVPLPLLFVAIPEMPMGALAEVEVVCATRKAATCLEIKSTTHVMEGKSGDVPINGFWDTGHDFPVAVSPVNSGIHIHASTRSMGNSCAAMTMVTAKMSLLSQNDCNGVDVVLENLLDDMFEAFTRSIGYDVVGLTMEHVIHVRLYYIGASQSENGSSFVAMDDGVRLRSALQCVLASRCAQVLGRQCDAPVLPACTVVPVRAIKGVHSTAKSKDDEPTTTIMAMNILAADPVHMETELWIHNGRGTK